ncbi:hypothetical protein [Planomicrobium sp. MB-3u-38]|uniref:hypothetical protein n=1 Tax=Planomicrobium sp. MB-3u-38 TaxID=2058318 RepID=UPI000C7DB805|nr:hypothetical protein [Planomicrobium sp. MB-3u-38]PKH10317.1 hypothetical protein CXF70_10355 [Planomicrobium sp. MB-3u-38]
MKKKLIIVTSIFFLLLSACQKEDILIESASIEFGSLENPADRQLHFRTTILDAGMEQEGINYEVRFIIEDAYIVDIVGSEVLRVSETFDAEHNNSKRAVETGVSIGLMKDYNIDEIKKIIEKEKVVFAEVYSGEQVIDRKRINTFIENIQPLVDINPSINIEKIELKTDESIDIFKKAVFNAEKDNSVIEITHPKHSFALEKETYYIWIFNENGRIMNTRDVYSSYLLNDESFKEIKSYLSSTDINE